MCDGGIKSRERWREGDKAESLDGESIGHGQVFEEGMYEEILVGPAEVKTVVVVNALSMQIADSL